MLTNGRALNDVSSYYTLLDGALMKFHGEKMKAINDSMRNLWQDVYRGTDIDYIQIRSDVDADFDEDGNIIGDAAVETQLKKRAGSRSYNYRLVMILGNGAELDMRGRCSAGQKILASLITRLALAESFSLHCGVLTLDEPTTNLDRENIEALAIALKNMIDSRKGHEGFQMMIITHDETFVKLLSQQQICSHYWRVKKDPQKGTSLLSREDFGTL